MFSPVYDLRLREDAISAVLIQFLFPCAGIVAFTTILTSIAPSFFRIIALLSGTRVPSERYYNTPAVPRRVPRHGVRSARTRRNTLSSWAA